MTCEIEREGRLGASVGAVDVGAIHLGGAEAAVTPAIRHGRSTSESLRLAGALVVVFAVWFGLSAGYTQMEAFTMVRTGRRGWCTCFRADRYWTDCGGTLVVAG